MGGAGPSGISFFGRADRGADAGSGEETSVDFGDISLLA